MKNLILFLTFITTHGFSQDSLHYFALEDTTFVEGSIYRLEEIRYEYHQEYGMSKESTAELDKIVSFMEQNYLLWIEIGAHTDARGSIQSNNDLSLRRAKSLENYLDNKGISKFSITTKGYGETTPYTVRASDTLEHPYLKVGQLLTESAINSLPREHWEACFALNRRAEIKIRGILSKPQVVPIVSEAVLSQETYVIPDIRFELGTAILQRASYEQIDLIVEFMENNPSVVLEIGNHCDCRASDKYSIRYTQRRADSIVQYMIKKGIPEDRLIPKGYFKNVPITEDGVVYTCEYINRFKDDKPKFEELQQKRRRTEIRIIATDYVPPTNGKDNSPPNPER